MTKPIDNPPRPARPPRRFSAIKPPQRRAAARTAADVEAPAAAEVVEPVSPAPPPAKPAGAGDEARVAKVMSRAGLCSRRDAEAWILAGRVAINGTTITSPALNIGPADAITVDGFPIEKPEHTRLFMFHKTRGLVTTAKDPEGRPTIYDALPDDLPRLITIGRLDINTEGLLLLTNDGGLARLLELPATGWLRRYRVRANGRVDQAQLDALAKGVTVDGVDYAGIDAKLDRIQGANLWMTLGLREGKNREVKRVLEHLGLSVSRLIRISFGPFQLGDLAENAVEEVKTRVLRDQLGSTLAKQAGVDLDRSDERREPDHVEPLRGKPSRGDAPRRAAGAVTPEEPRRKTSRTATADRKGRAVTVERISTPGKARAEDGSRPPRRSRDDRPATGRAESARVARPDARDGQAERGPGRPRTLRQAEAKFGRAEAGARPTRPSRGDDERPASRARGEGDRRGQADRPGRADRPERSAASRDRPREGGAHPTRDGAPRVARDGASRPFRDGAPRPARGNAAARDDRREGGPGKRFSRPATGRSEGGDRGGRPGKPTGFKGGSRPGGKAPGGGGRGRPRG